MDQLLATNISVYFGSQGAKKDDLVVMNHAPIRVFFAVTTVISLCSALCADGPGGPALRGAVRTANSSSLSNWPRWRGPNADGAVDRRNLPTHWSQVENVRWSVKLPGWGTSSPVINGDRLFVTSQVEQDGKKSLLTLCFHRDTGKELWRHDFGMGVDQQTHQKSNLAVNTPAVTEDAVYVAFGNADIARYSHDGKLIWVTRYMAIFGDPKMAWGCSRGIIIQALVI